MGRIATATGLAGIKALFDGRYQPLVGADGLLAIPAVAEIAMLAPSNVQQEAYAALSAAPGLATWDGELVIAALMAGKLDLIAQTRSAALGIPKDDFDDDRIGLHRARVDDLAVKATWDPMRLVAQTLEANKVAYDGLALFHDTRTMGDSGTIDNNLVPAMAGTAPTVVEYETAVKAAIDALRSYRDEAGDKIAIGAEFATLNPMALSWQAKACAENETLGPAGSLKVNEVRGTFTAGTNPFLTSDVTMYTWIRNRSTKPLIVQEREPLTTELLGEGTDEWVKRDRAIFKVRARRAMAAGHPAYIVKSLFTHA